MIIVISPAKTLDFKSESPTDKYTLPKFSAKADLLAKKLKKLSTKKLSDLLGISPKLAQLNVERYAEWTSNAIPPQAKQALFAYDGDVYDGLIASTLSLPDIEYAQVHLRILSGLYGVLKPLDLIQPHRLEMGTPIEVNRYKNLYQFWGKTPAVSILQELKQLETPAIINLASMEYFKVIDKKLSSYRIITPIFKEYKSGEYSIISVFAKKARGMMSRFAIQHKINDPEHLKAFGEEGYLYNENLSTQNNWVFTRG